MDPITPDGQRLAMKRGTYADVRLTANELDALAFFLSLVLPETKHHDKASGIRAYDKLVAARALIPDAAERESKKKRGRS